MPDHSSFYRAILADPENELPKWAFADWLTENGDPPRGEFIRTQCRTAKMRYYEPGFWRLLRRGDQLLAEHRQAWLDGYADTNDQIQFAWGFPFMLSIGDPIEESLRLLDTLPTVNNVFLNTRPSDEILIRRAVLPRLSHRQRRPVRSNIGTDPDDLKQCTDKLISLASRLQSVSIIFPDQFGALLDSMFTDDRWEKLSYMSCFGPSWDESRLLQLLDSERWKTLRHLQLRKIPPKSEFLSAIRKLTNAELTTVTFSDLDKSVFDAFMENDNLAGLESLSLFECRLEAISTLESGQELDRLEHLQFPNLGIEDIATLLTWRFGSSIKSLRLLYSSLPDNFFDLLMASNFHSLKLLEIKPEPRHAEQLRAFLASPFASGMTLHLNQVDMTLVKLIADAPMAKDLHINLSMESADDDVIRAIMDNELGSRITVLNAWQGVISPEVVREMIGRDCLQNVEDMTIYVDEDKTPSSLFANFEHKFGVDTIKYAPSSVL